MPVINKDNYEHYFIDYLDGVLSQSEVKQLLSFLNSNPILKKEIEQLESLRVISENIVFPQKAKLKKQTITNSIFENNFNELCISKIERNLTLKQNLEFDELINQSNELKKQFDIFEKTILYPDLNITYENKLQLKKSSFSKTFHQFAIAASIILIISLAILTPKRIQDNLPSKIHISAIPVNKNVEIPSSMRLTSNASSKEMLLGVNEADSLINQYKISTKVIQTDSNYNNELILNALQPLEQNPIIFSSNESKTYYLKPLFKTPLSNDLILANNKKNINSLKGFIIHSIRKNILKQENESNKIHIYDIAQLTITGINKVSGSKMSLKKKYDSNGILNELEFNSKLIAFSTPIKE